ncbi:MAG: hypothetical protein IIB59_05440 [Planctomycetes bacterium]|nr:hypothetical protein [Planctomycetota bacterium]
MSFFPQLVVGPIERSSHLLPQILKQRVVVAEDLRTGLYLIVYGLFKKIIVADNMAVIVNHVFSQSPSTLSGTDVLLGVYAFAFQIYGDFQNNELNQPHLLKSIAENLWGRCLFVPNPS